MKSLALNLKPAGVPSVRRNASPPQAARLTGPTEQQSSTDQVDLSQARESQTKGLNTGLWSKLFTLGMLGTALVGCTGSGAVSGTLTQQLADPAVAEQVQPANPFELMRMKDGSIAVSADLKGDDAYVLAHGAAIRQDGGEEVALRTRPGSTLCEQATALGGSCLSQEQVVVNDPSGPLVIETFAREGEAIHRLEAKPQDGSGGGIELNKLPAGTEVFSDNGSGLLRHNGDLDLYPDLFK